MDIKIHENSWTISVHNTNIRDLSDEQIEQIAPLIASNITVVLPSQHDLTPDEYRKFVHKLGKVQVDGTATLSVTDSYVLPGTDNEIIRVTGEKTEEGKNKGIFSQKEELIWHCNESGRLDRPDVLCLYGVTGTEGSITSYTNTQLAYQDLLTSKDAPAGLIEALPELEAFYDYGVNLNDVRNTLSSPNYLGPKGQFPLLLKNKSGKLGLYISPKQRPVLYRNGVELPRKTKYNYVSFLYDFLTQDKYVYDHHWKDGDLVLNCQWHSLHKRNHFEQVEQRLLWRMMITL